MEMLPTRLCGFFIFRARIMRAFFTKKNGGINAFGNYKQSRRIANSHI